MQVQTEARVIEAEGLDNPTKTFSISQNKRMFEILSSNIYSDKILAVIREYGCNAYDAHIAAGKPDVPFLVHLPNEFEPWFAVKDYGTGLSHDDVMGLYSTYGYSTKNESNDAIGMLGLGSKSGFAYSDQFTVTSVHDGKMRVYSAFVDKDGSPTITLLSEEDTDDHPGLEINIPVKSSDFYNFASRAAKIFFRFPVQPEVVGNKIDMPKIEYPITGPNYKVRANSHDGYSYDNGAFAIQGVVAYPINVRSFTSDKLTYEIKQVLEDLPIDIFFPIGKLDVAASREALNYDVFTQENIIEAVKEIIEHIPNQFKDVLSDCKTLWEAKKFYYEWLSNQERHTKVLLSLLGEKLKWNGQVIENNNIHVKLYDMVDVVNQEATALLGDETELLMKKVPQTWGRHRYFGSNDLNLSRKSSPSDGFEMNIKAEDGTIILIDNKPLKAPVRSTQMLFEGKDRVHLIQNVDPKNYKKLLKAMGNPPNVLYTADMEEPAPPPKEVKQKSDVKTLYQIYYYSHYSFDLRETQKDVTEGGLFLVTYNKKPLALDVDENNPNKIDENLFNVMNYMNRFHLLPTPIYAFNSTHKKIALDNPGWVSAYKPMQKILEKMYSKKNKKLIEAWSFFYYINNSDDKSYNENYKKREQGKKFVEFIDFIDKAKAEKLKLPVDFYEPYIVAQKYRGIINKCMKRKFGLSDCIGKADEFFDFNKTARNSFEIEEILPKKKYSNSAIKLVKDYKDRYPAMDTLMDHATVHQTVHYINMCDYFNQKETTNGSN